MGFFAFHMNTLGMRVTPMAANGEGGGWRDWDDDEEPRDWEIESEEERSDRNPTLSGTAPLARVVFLGFLGLILLGGVLALIRGLGSWLDK